MKIPGWPRGRVLHFVRHGQYDDGESGSGQLTALGRKQASGVARHFKGWPIQSVVSSDLPRALETADILRTVLGIERVRHYRVLREMLPTRLPGLRIPVAKRVDGAERLERIVQLFFKPSRQTRHEVVVCHGNLIRALVMRVTSGRADGWQRLAIDHGGITSFVIAPRDVIVLGVNSQEHLPLRLRSQT